MSAGEYIVDSAFVYLGGHDFTGDIHTWAATGTTEQRDKTTFRNRKARKWKSGLFTTVLSMAGYADMSPGGQDEQLFTAYGTRAVRGITAGNLEAEGEPCCLMQQLTPAFTPGGGGKVGDLAPFRMSGAGTDGYGGIRGVLLLEQTTVSTTGAKGTAVQLGNVDADQRLFGILHLLGTPGTSITAVIESDDNGSFTSATTRYTWTALTTEGGYWANPVSGAITDDWWRIRVTAVTGSWTVACSIGIE